MHVSFLMKTFLHSGLGEPQTCSPSSQQFDESPTRSKLVVINDRWASLNEGRLKIGVAKITRPKSQESTVDTCGRLKNLNARCKLYRLASVASPPSSKLEKRKPSNTLFFHKLSLLASHVHLTNFEWKLNDRLHVPRDSLFERNLKAVSQERVYKYFGEE